MPDMRNARKELEDLLTKFMASTGRTVTIVAAKVCFCWREGHPTTGNCFTLKKGHSSDEFLEFFEFLSARDYDAPSVTGAVPKVNARQGLFAGYGGRELYGVVWFSGGVWATRGEYDGSEWWNLHHVPDLPGDDEPTGAFMETDENEKWVAPLKWGG